MQTLDMLNQKAGTAHLDISENNIMLSETVSNKWDQLRLLDFGLAQPCNIGTAVNSNTSLRLYHSQTLVIACKHADSGCHSTCRMHTT